MLVCPSCRSENQEDATVCRHCGNQLEAVSSPMRRMDRTEDEEEPQLDEIPARQTSPWPLVIGTLAIGLGLLGWGLFAALRPNPCQGKYSSALFSYCVERPEGWVGGSTFNPGGDLDVYQRVSLSASEEAEPTASVDPTASAEPTVQAEPTTSAEPTMPAEEVLVEAVTTVEVSQLLDPTVSTPQYVQQFRTSQVAGGLDPSPVRRVIIDGEQALGWDFTLPLDPASPFPYRRVIIAVRPDGAWQIQFAAREDAYAEARRGLTEMLRSWRWKS